jgi:hypothetical protein
MPPKFSAYHDGLLLPSRNMQKSQLPLFCTCQYSGACYSDGPSAQADAGQKQVSLIDKVLATHAVARPAIPDSICRINDRKTEDRKTKLAIGHDVAGCVDNTRLVIRGAQEKASILAPWAQLLGIGTSINRQKNEWKSDGVAAPVVILDDES